MTRCAYCGRENDDGAALCRECGGELTVETVVSEAPPPAQKIALLQNEIEAELLEEELTNRNIPHCLISYHDSAFDGLFQLYRGWGHVEAPTEFKDAIVSVLEDIRAASPEPKKPASSPDGNEQD